MKVTLLGAGLFVNQRYVPALQKLQGEGLIDVVSVFSRNSEKSEAVASALNARAFSGDSLGDAIGAAPSGSAALVCLPIPMLPTVAKQCADAGLYVLAEKPVGPSEESARLAVQHYCDNVSTVVVGIAENFRHESGARAAAAKSAELFGAAGGPALVHMTVRAQVNDQNPYYHTPWRVTPDYTGSYILDGGVHAIAVLRLLVGSDITQLSGRVKSSFPASIPPPDTIAASFQFDNGCTGTLNGMYGPLVKCESIIDVELVGRCGNSLMVSVTPEWTFTVYINGALEGTYLSDGVEQEMRDFFSAVSSRSSVPPSLDPRGALKDAQFLFTCFAGE